MTRLLAIKRRCRACLRTLLLWDGLGRRIIRRAARYSASPCQRQVARGKREKEVISDYWLLVTRHRLAVLHQRTIGSLISSSLLSPPNSMSGLDRMNQNKITGAVVQDDESYACALAAWRFQQRLRPGVEQASIALIVNAGASPTLERKD